MTDKHQVIVAGSRDITDVELIRDHMNRLWDEIGPYEVVSGMARGVDRISASIARQGGVKVHEFWANWERWGRSAGYRRNELMAKEATHLLAFWDGASRGTKHMIDLAVQYGLRVQVYNTAKQLLIKY